MTIRTNLDHIRERIHRACDRAGRSPDTVEIVAVCKDQPADSIREAIESGIHILGENKLQEAEIHMKNLEGSPVCWHFIGNLQKNKINHILQVFHLIQSVDGIKNLEHIHKRVEKPVDLFIEINIGEEKTKSGFTLEGLKKALDYISRLDKIRIIGFMTIPPFLPHPESSRPYFVSLRRFQDEINRMKIPNIHIRHLSMGMSHDFEIAVEEGSTMVRIGTALFGKRAPRPSKTAFQEGGKIE